MTKLVWQQNFFKTFLTNSWWNCFVSSMAVGNMEMPQLNGKNIAHDAQILRRISAPLPTYSSSTKCLPTWSSNEWSNHWKVFSTRSTTRFSFRPKNGTTCSENNFCLDKSGAAASAPILPQPSLQERALWEALSTKYFRPIDLDSTVPFSQSNRCRWRWCW